MKRTQQLRNIRHQPALFTVLAREIPLCSEHKTHGCSVDHFFSKNYPYTYQSYQMLYDATDLEKLVVRIYSTRSCWCPNICVKVSLLLRESCFSGFNLCSILFPRLSIYIYIYERTRECMILHHSFRSLVMYHHMSHGSYWIENGVSWIILD